MTTGSSSLTVTIGGGDVFVPSDFEAMRSTQMNRFGSLVILLGCIFMGLLLGLTEYTSYADDPVRVLLTDLALRWLLMLSIPNILSDNPSFHHPATGWTSESVLPVPGTRQHYGA
jgi:hypothetical protein